MDGMGWMTAGGIECCITFQRFPVCISPVSVFQLRVISRKSMLKEFEQTGVRRLKALSLTAWARGHPLLHTMILNCLQFSAVGDRGVKVLLHLR